MKGAPIRRQHWALGRDEVEVGDPDQRGSVLAVLGPCAAGKTTLVLELRRRGYVAREVAQEHSAVPDLWRKRGHPGPMVFLDVSPEIACNRRGIAVVPSWWSSASSRLEMARRDADLYLCTDELSREQVLSGVLAYLVSLGWGGASADGVA